MSKKNTTDNSSTSDKRKHDYNLYRDKNKTLGDPSSKSDNRRSTTGTGPRDQDK